MRPSCILLISMNFRNEKSTKHSVNKIGKRLAKLVWITFAHYLIAWRHRFRLSSTLYPPATHCFLRKTDLSNYVAQSFTQVYVKSCSIPRILQRPVQWLDLFQIKRLVDIIILLNYHILHAINLLRRQISR
jgi:hypothetical protein